MFIQKTHNRETQQGQILLITVMLLAAAVTVVMTIAFNSTTETQITRLEEDSQKALSAAESALEAAVQQKTGTVAINTLPAFAGTNITGQAEVIEMSGYEFVTPLLQRDEQYTFYMAGYDYEANTWAESWPVPYAATGDITVYLQTEQDAGGCPGPALELTFIDAANNTNRKAIIDPCGVIDSTDGQPEVPTAAGGSLKNVNFDYKTTGTGTALTGISGMKVMMVRVLNMATRVGFQTSVSTPFKSQGRVVSSEAKTQSGVTKKIELFQSNPQIPADFFVTSF